MIKKGAKLSDCRNYRYSLWRQWLPGPSVMFIGLNPSTADESTDDHTIRRCMDFAKRWGYSGIVMTNLFAYRSTDPAGLETVDDPIGPENDYYLELHADEAQLVVACWGNHGQGVRSGDVKRMFAIAGAMWCLGFNTTGAPKHPARLKTTTTPVPYEGYCLSEPAGTRAWVAQHSIPPHDTRPQRYP